MTVTATAAEPAPASQPDTGADPRKKPTGETEASNVFAGLLAAVQGSVGSRATFGAPRLHHGSDPSGAAPADARQARLDRMADRENAEQINGRSSRLDPRGGSTGDAVGPRGLRLAMEQQDLAHRPSAEPTEKSVPESGPRQRPTVAGTVDRSTPEPVRAAAQAPQVDVSPNDKSSDRGNAIERVGRPAELHADRQANRGGVTSGVEASRASTAPVAGQTRVETPKPSNRPESIARQIGRILAGRAEAPQSARAVTGVEQAGGARTAVGSDGGQPANRASGRRSAAAEQASRPSDSRNTESTGRSAFEKLVRSARVQVNPSQSTVRLRLDPPELGWIRVEARVEGSAVHLSVQTENATAGELLRGRLAQLETALERHGLHIERFELVARGADGRADPAGEPHLASGGDDHPPPDPDESASEREDQRPATPTASGLAAPDPEGPGRTEAAADEIASAAPAGSATRLDVRV